MGLSFCEEMVSTFKDGLSTHIEGNGKNLSGGQIQRICIARALLARPKILILDEATTGLDQKMAKQIIRDLFNIGGLTTIIISHNMHSDFDNCRLINLETFSSSFKEKNMVSNIVTQLQFN